MGQRPHSTPPGVIFDLDGTLADTLDDITKSINVVFVNADCAPVSRERIRGLIGEGLKSLLRRASEIEDTGRLDTLVDHYREVYRAQMLEVTQLYPGIAAMLDGLARRDVPMAVLSNKPHEFTVPICEDLLQHWPFVRYRGSLDEASRKPDPGAAIELAKQMDRSPADVFLIGDSVVDLRTGTNAGMVPVAVTWGYRDRGELDEAGAARCVDVPSELLDLF